MTSKHGAQGRLTVGQLDGIRKNLFRCARPIVDEAGFPWHREASGEPSAAKLESSQALALDLFQTVKTLESRDEIIDGWCRRLNLNMSGPWDLKPECPIDRDLLNESRPTQVDVMACSDAGVLLFECKFTEPDGGGCSQTRPLRRPGPNCGKIQCDGTYRQQINPVNGVRSRCALTGKGIQYWQHVPSILGLQPDEDHVPCPFSGGWYQWMRNLAAARALSLRLARPTAFIIAFADGDLPMAHKLGYQGHPPSMEWTQFGKHVEKGQVPLRTVTYQSLLEVAHDATPEPEQQVLADLKDWMERKIDGSISIRNGIIAAE